MKMKSTKGTKVTPREEECGKWLDTTELKEKKQKPFTRPVYKLLNPLGSSRSYNVPVVLNFTQTKLNMPVTRQSTISAFFSPRSKDTSVHTCCQAKRKHGVTLEPLEDDEGDEDVKEQTFLQLMHGYEPDKEEPLEKKRALINYTDHHVSETQEYWNKEASVRSDSQTIPETETLFHWESQRLDPLIVRKPFEEVCGNVPQASNPKDLQGFKDKRVLRDPVSTIEGSVLTSRSVNANSGKPNAFSIASKDQVQSYCKSKAMKPVGKENSRPASPIHNTPLSPFKQNLISSPAKSRLKDKCLSLKKLGNENSGSGMAGDRLAMLFTQDSEGFCVIAHREQHLRSPLKDHTNVSAGGGSQNSPSVRSSEKEEEDSDLDVEMLFTQDSEGNMVIKH